MRDIQNKRYFGMTVVQLVVLGCLALAALGTILGGGIFITTSMQSPSPEETAPEFTPTPEFTATPVFTETPTLPPTITPIPYEQLIPPGWNQQLTTDVEMWLPIQFKPVNVESERQDRIDFYKKLGHDKYAGELEATLTSYVFWFKGPEAGSPPYAANITVEFESMTIESLDAYLDQQYPEGSSSAFRVASRNEFQIGQREAKRVLLESSFGDVYVGVAQYVFYDGVRLWQINCSSHFNEFYTWLPEFDKVARTFRLLLEQQRITDDPAAYSPHPPQSFVRGS